MSKYLLPLCFLCFLFIDTNLMAQSEADENKMEIPDLRTMRTMNGIDPAPYDRFWEKWPLVTTRYREDKGEQRFVYANQIAYEAMKRGDLMMPEGAALGKIAFIADEDPQFPNSYEPTNFTRLQLMVKDSKKFADMDGWSYWLYTDGANSPPEEDHANNLACHACHTLVKEKDFVFSAPSFLGHRGKMYGDLGTTFKRRFRKRRVKDLTTYERKILGMLPSSPKSVRSLRMRLFSGSLYESIGPLSRYVKDGSVYLLFDPVQKRFIAVNPLKSKDGCKAPAMIVMDRPNVKRKNKKVKTTRYIGKGILCDGKNRWVKSLDMPTDLKL